MFKLSEKWGPLLVSEPETGMGYQVASVALRDGSRFEQVLIVEGCVTKIRGLDRIPFTESQIAEIVVTHDKWDFAAE